MANKKYDKLQHWINLPEKISISAANKTLFQKNLLNQDESKYISPEIKTVRDDLINRMEKNTLIWADTSYQFKFPESKFPSVPPGQRNNISYEQKNEVFNEDTFADRLTDEQIEQIKEKGEFQVKSNSPNATIPYVWKINECLLKGRVNRVNIWEDGLASCYQLLWTARQFFVQTIPSSCKQLALMPVRFFALIFGKKKLSCIYTPDYRKEVTKDFWTDIFKNELSNLNYEIGHEFLESIFLQYEPAMYREVPDDKDEKTTQKLQIQRNEKIDVYNIKKNKMQVFKDELKAVENEFQSNWVKIRKNVLAKISSENEQYQEKSMMIQGDEAPLSSQLLQKKDQSILEKFHQEKYLIYTAHLKENLPKLNIGKNVIEALVSLVIIFSLVEAKMKMKDDKLFEISKKIRQKITKEHSIRARSYQFADRVFMQEYEPIQEKVENQFFDELLNSVELLSYFNDKYKLVYTKYVKFRKNIKILEEQKQKTMKQLYTPYRTFETTYILFPPYQVQKLNGYYYLKREQKMQCDTGTHFWKCVLYAMRLKSWSLNCFKAMVGLSWASPLGFRCLCGIEDFAYDEHCNSTTGRKSQVTRPTLLGVFGKVLDGISESRQAFEALPDLGLFGKKCSRLCNLLECYVFRFFFLGVIGVLMLYPVAIIIFSSICLLIGLTFWIWVPLAMILVYLFNILVFQFEASNRHAGCLIKGVPLISLLCQIIFHIFKMLAAILFLLIIAPLLCFLYFLFLILQRVLRTFTDAVIVCFVGCCGRTPSTDTAIASKISGPGMSSNYFYSINQQDVYILIQASLQQILHNKIVELTRGIINQNLVNSRGLNSFVLRPFGYTQAGFAYERDIVSKNNQSLLNSLNYQSNNYKNRYPRNPYNIRFTQQEIELYFENTTKIVKNFVEKNQMQDWIFENNQLLYEDYDELTRKIWIQIFGCGQQIFEPLEKIDSRFKLATDGNTNKGIMKQNITAIMKALEGEVELGQKRPVFNAAKRSLLDRDEKMSYIEKICATHSANSEVNLSLNLNDPTSLLIPPRNLEFAKDYDLYQYEKLKRSNPKVIEI